VGPALCNSREHRRDGARVGHAVTSCQRAYRPNRELVYFGGALFATIASICAYSIKSERAL
jgi:hypothetical protein